MIPKVKEDWLTALRSGDYEQTRGVLAEPRPSGEVHYCCLGVLADVHWPNLWYHDENIDKMYLSLEDDDEEDRATGELTMSLLEEINLGWDQQQDLIRLNDGNVWNENPELNPDGAVRSTTNKRFIAGKEPQSFSVIADYIEENL